WEEEYQLVQEEMRWVVAYFTWKAEWWWEQAKRRTHADHATQQGISAYAQKQAFIMNTLAHECMQQWLPALAEQGIVPSWTAPFVGAISSNKSAEGGTGESDDLS
ncbi:hypothetical protein BYT27DRAFT_7075222, partial [Phlegmacium glaucopus]